MRNREGFMVDTKLITATDITTTISALPDMTDANSQSLLYPTDRQNVPMAVSLIQHLLQVHSLPLPSDPGLRTAREKVNFMSEMLGCFVLPFITVTMTLSMQLESLSKYSHLAAAMFVKHGLACITGALYADSQSIVKNIFLTVARLQVIDKELCFYLLMEGTDRLENLFCECRTQDHSRNFDIEQLSQKLSVATLINATFERNPDLNRGHRKLNLQGAIGIDRINPQSWEGNTCVGKVNLQNEWDSGREKAFTTMRTFLGLNFAPDLVGIFSQPEHDILRPAGEYVGVKSTADDARSEEEAAANNDIAIDPTAIIPLDQAATEDAPCECINEAEQEPTSLLLNHAGDVDEETFQNSATIVAFAADIDGNNPEHIFENSNELNNTGIELDDYFPETQEGLSGEEEPEIFSHILTDGDKDYLKSALIASLRPAQWKRIPVRPFRVQGKTLESVYATRSSVGPEVSIDTNELASKDLVAFLVISSDAKFCLAVLEVVGFRFKNEKTLKLRMGLEEITNGRGDYKVNGQIIELSQNMDDIAASRVWDWTERYIHLDVSTLTTRLTQKQFVLEVPVSLIFPVAAIPVRIANLPVEISSNSESNPDSSLTWRIKHADLDNILKTAWDSLNGEGDDILRNLPLLRKVNNPNVIPYRDQSGELIYVLVGHL
jgi:hypothetical protein